MTESIGFDEQEFIVNYCPVDKYVSIYSSYRPFIRKLKAAAADGNAKIVRETDNEIEVEVLRENFFWSIRQPRSTTMSDAARAAAAARLLAARNKKLSTAPTQETRAI